MKHAMHEPLHPTVRAGLLRLILGIVITTIALGVIIAVSEGNPLEQVLWNLALWLVPVMLVGFLFVARNYRATKEAAPRTIHIRRSNPVKLMALVAPGRYQNITHEEAITLLKTAIEENAYVKDIQHKLTQANLLNEQLRAQLAEHDTASQHAIDTAVAKAQAEYRDQLEQQAIRHTKSYKHVEGQLVQAQQTIQTLTGMAEAAEATQGKRGTREDLLAFLRLAIAGELTRETPELRNLVPMPATKYSAFAAAVRDIVEGVPLVPTPSPTRFIHPAFADLHADYIEDLSLDESGEGEKNERTDEPTNEPTFPLTRYDADFAEFQGCAS